MPLESSSTAPVTEIGAVPVLRTRTRYSSHTASSAHEPGPSDTSTHVNCTFACGDAASARTLSVGGGGASLTIFAPHALSARAMNSAAAGTCRRRRMVFPYQDG